MLMEKLLNNMTEILVLDFNREEELKSLLQSLRQHCKFEHKIVVLNNGGRKYANQLFEQGLCDKVINNSINIGCGAATSQLFAQCESDFAFYVQVDQQLACDIKEENVLQFKTMILSGEYFHIDLAGDQAHGVYSERAHFISKSNYFKVPLSFGGPGPLCDLDWSEGSVQQYMKINDLKYISIYAQSDNGTVIPPFLDRGVWSMRENPDGSKWKHKTDTKQLWLLSGPVKERFDYPDLTEEEWSDVLINQTWEDGKIPKNQEKDSFVCW